MFCASDQDFVKMKLSKSYLHLHLFIQDMSREPPAQELVAKDLHGTEWRFRHIYRGTYYIFFLAVLYCKLIFW